MTEPLERWKKVMTKRTPEEVNRIISIKIWVDPRLMDKPDVRVYRTLHFGTFQRKYNVTPASLRRCQRAQLALLERATDEH